MELLALRVGDYVWHGPTNQGGILQEIVDESTHTTLDLDGERFHVTQTGFDMWWNVERDDVQIHWQSHRNDSLKEGRVEANG